MPPGQTVEVSVSFQKPATDVVDVGFPTAVPFLRQQIGSSRAGDWAQAPGPYAWARAPAGRQAHSLVMDSRRRGDEGQTSWEYIGAFAFAFASAIVLARPDTLPGGA